MNLTSIKNWNDLNSFVAKIIVKQFRNLKDLWEIVTNSVFHFISIVRDHGDENRKISTKITISSQQKCEFNEKIRPVDSEKVFKESESSRKKFSHDELNVYFLLKYYLNINCKPNWNQFVIAKLLLQ